MIEIKQNPAPNEELIFYHGNKITFSLFVSSQLNGEAFLRSNIGNAKIHRKEIIDLVENDVPRTDADWRDTQMLRISEREYTITLELNEVGTFEAKAFFRKEGGKKIIWPEGGNVRIKVEPAHTYCGNSIYTAFIRQFSTDGKTPGTFRQFAKNLDHIIYHLGFKNIQLLPVFPVPTSFARMGEFGSPFAVLDFENVNPAYAEFDKRATPIQQFTELVDAVHSRDARIFLDIPINHTGWASRLQIHHPEWFARNSDGTFKSPGAWGVIWEDLSELDYSHKKLWEYMARVFRFWCECGVDGFRCDAGYMVPQPVWEYIIAKIRDEFPDTIFFLEGLGGKITVTKNLLSEAGMNWAYSELFQNYDRMQIENYLPKCIEISNKQGLQIHFAETHDNNRLAQKSEIYAKFRTAVAALFSQNGGFGITAGVEWFATEKIDVHKLNDLNWGSENNQINHIKKLNETLINRPAFFADTKLKLIQIGSHNGIVLLRENIKYNDTILIVANFDEGADESFITWREEDFPCTDFYELISEKKVIAKKSDGIIGLVVKPMQILCLTSANIKILPKIVLEKKNEIDNSPLTLTKWDYPQDLKRKVIVPENNNLLLRAPIPFDVKVYDDNKVIFCKKSSNGAGNFVIIPFDIFIRTKEYSLRFTFFTKESIKHEESKIIVLSSDEKFDLNSKYSKQKVVEKNIYALLTNGRGAMAQVRGEWAILKSKYDAFLAANLSSNCPVDRHIFLTRCRAWILSCDYSCEINTDNLLTFEKLSNNAARWIFRLPIGQGNTVDLSIETELVEGENVSIVKFCRLQTTKYVDSNSEEFPIKIIVRPDIENRNFHSVTKAFLGAENEYPAAVKACENSFKFSPRDMPEFSMRASKGKFVSEPEWQYNVYLPEEAERGLEDHTDLFSPGYFSFGLSEGEIVEISAETDEKTDETDKMNTGCTNKLKAAINQFIVKRDDSLTVIAGYPWFLDWGRDTLIALRGIISAGFIDEAKDILKQFAKFEENGTLPNMIRGNDQSNRDTSDAPLWFFVACSDLMSATKELEFINQNCGGRTVGEVMKSIINNYISGTPNGIKMDEDSGLIFSPSHFTWMDTNFPAGTPREGYPIEIQSLWFFALNFFYEISKDEKYKILAEKVTTSIENLFTKSQNNCLSDCLHCQSGTRAADAFPDDAVRPNQLFTVTLGAIKDKKLCQKIIAVSEQLLVPGAIRSLADLPVNYQLPIYFEGKLLNEPKRPYFGEYSGDEDMRRKPAYHNGTAWTWQFPSFAEALLLTFGKEGEAVAKSILLSSKELFESGCVLQLPEIVDGDYPHKQKGCGAQAWGITELYRLLKMTNMI